jgi:hypothetical protein
MAIGTGGAIMCWHCLEWHERAKALFAGHPPPGCQVCGVSFAALCERQPDGDIRMYIHAKDRVYQVLCPACSDIYIRKRVDLYGATAFGHSRKLAG